MLDRPLLVLFIDDDPDDQYLIKRAIRRVELNIDFRTLSSGVELLELLSEEQFNHQENLPSLILLDLNMPILDGMQVLKSLKSNPKHADIPVVVYTTSTSSTDALEAKELGAHSVKTKPGTYIETVELIQEICEEINGPQLA
ncbi:response regulator [Aliikangiella sp. IMCC44653]